MQKLYIKHIRKRRCYRTIIDRVPESAKIVMEFIVEFAVLGIYFFGTIAIMTRGK